MERPFSSDSPEGFPAGPVEQSVFGGPCQSDRVQQQQQQPDNVYSDNPFIDHQWEEIITGRIPQPSSDPLNMGKAISYVAMSVVSLLLTKALLNRS